MIITYKEAIALEETLIKAGYNLERPHDCRFPLYAGN